jgi:hypothetical protein
VDSQQLALQLAQPYMDRPGTVGIMRTGSSLGRWADAYSDVDVIVVVEDDVHRTLSLRERHIVGIDRGPPRRQASDIMIRSWGELTSYVDSDWDLDHYPYKAARLLFDPTGRLRDVLARIVELPETVRQDRMRVHHHEVIRARSKWKKCLARGYHANAELTGVLGLFALSRLMFVAQSSWAASKDWTTNGLRDVGVPEHIVVELERALRKPSVDHLDGVLAVVHPWLDSKQLDFHHSPSGTGEWCAFDDRGVAASRKWCSFQW